MSPASAGVLSRLLDATDLSWSHLSLGDKDIETRLVRSRPLWRERGRRAVGDAADFAPSAGLSEEIVLDDLRATAVAVDQIAGDLSAMGPTAAKSIADHVARLKRQAAETGARLVAKRPIHIRAQLERAGLTAVSKGLKLNLGAGASPIPGWTNLDVWPAEIAIDLRWGLPFADGAAKFVFICHTLEHLRHPGEALAVLKEIRRVLEKEGVARIVVPDIETWMRAYAENDRSFFRERRKTWWWWPKDQTRLESFLAYAGVGAGVDAFGEAHRFGYDFETLRRLMRKSGFKHIERSAFMASREPALRVDKASAVAAARYNERYYSLFVEARR